MPIRREKVGLVVVAAGDRVGVTVARADHQVGVVGFDLGQQPRHLGRGVLAVGVEVGAEVVALAQRVEVAGLQRRAEALVERKRGDEDAALARPRRGRVGRAVVDDEDVGARQVLAHVGDHPGKRGLLIPGRDEDESPHAADSATPSRRHLATPPPMGRKPTYVVGYRPIGWRLC